MIDKLFTVPLACVITGVFIYAGSISTGWLAVTLWIASVACVAVCVFLIRAFYSD